MATIIFGAQDLMVKKQIRRFVLDNFSKPDDVEVIYLDSRKITENNLLDECQQMNLMCTDKVVVVENSNFLTAERTKDKFSCSDSLIEYLKSENPFTKLVFTVVYDKKLDSRNKIYKYISDKGRIVECKDLKINDWMLYITKFFEKRNVKIEKSAINELCKRCDGNLNIFMNETEKLLLYKMNNITLEDIKKVVTRPLEDNLFDILDLLLHNKKEQAIQTYRDLALQKVEPVVLISIISSSLLFLDKVLFLSKKRMSYSEIAKHLSCNPYRVINTIKSFGDVDSAHIKKTIDDLYSLDKIIKHNNIDRFYGFELFLINY